MAIDVQAPPAPVSQGDLPDRTARRGPSASRSCWLLRFLTESKLVAQGAERELPSDVGELIDRSPSNWLPRTRTWARPWRARARGWAIWTPAASGSRSWRGRWRVLGDGPSQDRGRRRPGLAANICAGLGDPRGFVAAVADCLVRRDLLGEDRRPRSPTSSPEAAKPAVWRVRQGAGAGRDRSLEGGGDPAGATVGGAEGRGRRVRGARGIEALSFEAAQNRIGDVRRGLAQFTGTSQYSTGAA